MYGYAAQRLIRDAGANIGDKIKVIAEGARIYEGILMPRIELGDRDCIIIKLQNGYNVGISAEKISSIEVIERARPKEEERITISVPEPDEVAILGCGGTIASKVEYTTGAVYPAITTDELLLSFPQLKEKKFRSRMLFTLLSEDMSPAHWQMVANEIATEIKSGCKGIIVMHGTDTMHYTSAALSFMLKTPIPIVLTGAQRSPDRGSSDALLNMLSSFILAESDVAEIGICMHGSINDDFCYFHPGTKVRKLHTSRRDAFKTVNRAPIAKVFYYENRIETLSKHKKRGECKLEIDTSINPNVCLVWLHPGIKPEFVEGLSKFYDGVVLAGTGLGHVPTNLGKDPMAISLIPAIKSLIERNIPVVIAPQTIFGRLNMNVYAGGRALLEAGVIGNYCDWLPEVALVKLMFVLGHTKDMARVRELMSTNMAGEIAERSEVYA